MPNIIAEVKTCSPYGFVSEQPWEELFELAQEVGDLVSIHTSSSWGGSFELLERACKTSTKPVLAKGFHHTDYEVMKALALGASAVLVVGRLPTEDLLSQCLIEPLTLQELRELDPNIKAVWNARYLNTGARKEASFEEARQIFPGWLCQASLIKSPQDVHSLADAVLVGTHLVEFAKQREAVLRQ